MWQNRSSTYEKASESITYREYLAAAAECDRATDRHLLRPLLMQECSKSFCSLLLPAHGH